MLKMGKLGWVSGSALVLLAACAARGGNTGLPSGPNGDDASTQSEGGSSSGSSSGSSGSSGGSPGGSSGSSTSSSGSSGGSSGATGDDGGGSSGATGDDGGGASPTCTKLAACCPLVTRVNMQEGMACSQAAASGMDSMCQLVYTMVKAMDPLCM
jgi:hypothetical protein